jgi:hypothetical protein
VAAIKERSALLGPLFSSASSSSSAAEHEEDKEDRMRARRDV